MITRSYLSRDRREGGRRRARRLRFVAVGLQQGREGLDLVPLVRAADPSLPIVAMTAWSTVPLAVAALRGGADDFVEKPWDNSRLLETVEAHVAAGRARRLARR